ncbi:polysaccharide deacetylase family protein [Paenibacillus radicis (ex Xue et al. 2023)]|uniref:Polysaccharide deacetylase family protein n=1 Tax=Paenibacillus radicis (ex Xue et al. 2023) TaxID=2972489 RepID=A0ABT1YNZ1_9BACL|nr:polysaccharide deacetylase family protein [Paenibacillus radicis (ex Xue et al. 2023)]MCR8634430.1 polysaccharide deacetylase family protein [Paenibacillus radicis (ex Xue et al. 2023)]
MNMKLTTLLAAMLILTSTACSNNPGTPAASQQPAPASPQVQGSTNTPQSPDQKSLPEKLTETAPVKPPVDSQPPSAGKDSNQPTTAPQPATKLYKMNPKSYDIVPIDPATTDKKVVLLTFDDGPRNKEVLEGILNTLDKHKAKAIFFVNGYLVKQKPELLKLIKERGQTIGNHSWDHIDLKKEGKEKIAQQVEDVQAIVKELTGSAPQFFRPPFGSGSDELRAKVKQENMLYMTWSNGSLDWEMSVKKNDPNKVISNVMEQLRGGSNILMHELPWTEKALDSMLTQLEEKQYGFVDPGLIEITP